jgi:hypothetical protein
MSCQVRILSWSLACALTVSGLASVAIAAPGPATTNAADAGPDFAVQGEYVGEMTTEAGKKKYGVQVIAYGDGKFTAVRFEGGLPGDGWERGQKSEEFKGETKDGVTTFTVPEGTAKITDGVFSVLNTGGQTLADFKKVERKSPTLGAKPPEGAVVLFDGTTADNFVGGKMTDDGLLMVGVKSKKSFGDVTLHLEFRTPFMPKATGQGRGNSGMYIQDRYEFQVLDSFGLDGKNNECGGIYTIKEPRVNACFPPLAWQTYDVDYTAPRFDGDGKKIKNARVTMRHNGIVIYDDFELPKLTPGGASQEAAMGPLALQNHGNPVNFRNIWVVEKK